MARSKPARQDPTKATAEVGWGPEDNNDAAATPITLEPVAGARRPRGPERAASASPSRQPAPAPQRSPDHDLSVDNSVDQAAIEEAAQFFMSRGDDRATAYAKARDYVLQQKQGVRDQLNRPQPPNARASAAEDRQGRFEEDYGVATEAPSDSGLGGQDGSGRDWGNWTPGMPIPQVSRGGMGPGDDSQRGPGHQKVPGQRGLHGGPVPVPDTMYDPKDIARYTTREWNPATGRYKPSDKDRAMAARGMVPIALPDGSVAYGVGAPYNEQEAQGSLVDDYVITDRGGTSGRAGPRQDLVTAGWVEATVDSPLGPQRVYRPGQRQKDQIANVDKRRLAERAGIPLAEAMGMDIADLRIASQGAAASDRNDARKAWRAQTMLAGGQPTGGPRGTKAATTALAMMPQEWQNAVLAKSLRPDLDGTTPLTVEANSAKNAMRLLNAELFAQGGSGDMRQQALEMQTRQKAADYADAEAAKLFGFNKRTLTPQEAARVRRRVEARFPGYGGVVDGLPIDGAEDAGRPEPGASGAPVPQAPTGRLGPTRPRPGTRYPNT